MIISRTPFRLSFMGGGTDLPSFYEGEEGAVLSTTINKYMYITVNDRFDETFRLSYSRTEICDSVDQIEHPIFKTVLKKYSQKSKGLELISMADIPSGTGLGSSSSFTVGLLHAVKSHLHQKPNAEELAQEACQIEIEELKEPIGKQDQYAAAYGGLSFIRFLKNGKVQVEPISISEGSKKALETSTLMFYTGITRSASKVLKEQQENIDQKRENMKEMKKLAEKSKLTLEAGDSLQKFGEILHEGWKLKRSLASGITNSKIDEWYERGLKAGATGGKILGAGGGGFLMLLCPPEKQAALKSELKDLRPIPISFEKSGSQIIFVG